MASSSSLLTTRFKPGPSPNSSPWASISHMPNNANESASRLDTGSIIRRKRDGNALTAAEMIHIARGAADDSINDAQLSAFLMATFLRGMEPEEVQSLTQAMRTSGVQLDLRRPAN